jgi:outer membrane putative beta-barrel porin/alpha-amylase
MTRQFAGRRRSLPLALPVLVAGVVNVWLSVPAEAQQSVGDVLSFLVTNRSIPTDDFVRDEAAAAATRDTISGLLLVELSALPISSSAGGFTYRLNPALGTVMRSSDSFGPFFTERSLTAGRARASFGIGYRSVTFDTIDGRDLRDGTLVSTASQLQGESQPFDVETMSLRIHSDTVIATANYGVTDRFEVGAALPIVRLTLSGQRVDTYRGRALIQATGSASASGLSDLIVRAKYNVVRRGASGVAVGGEVRLPTGDEENLLGAGETSIRPRLIASAERDRLGLHGEVGYAFGGLVDELDYNGAVGGRHAAPSTRRRRYHPADERAGGDGTGCRRRRRQVECGGNAARQRQCPEAADGERPQRELGSGDHFRSVVRTMKAAKTDGPAAEPILLTDATLEHVLDAFLPETPEATASASRARTRAAAAIVDDFASERPEHEQRDVARDRRIAESARPWRTYSAPEASAPVADAPRLPSLPARVAGRRLGTWAIAASVAIGLLLLSVVAIQTRLEDTSVIAENTAPPAGPPITDAPPASKTTAKGEVAPPASAVPPVQVHGEIAGDPSTPARLPPVTGAVLKGSLTRDAPPRRERVAPLTSPARDTVKGALPPAPSTVPTAPLATPPAPPAKPAAASPPEPARDPPAAVPVEAARAPSAPPPPRDAAPAVRDEPPAAPSPTASSMTGSAAISDTASIETVLNRYRQAFGALDATAARAVWPGVDAKTLGRAFDQLVEQQLDFQNCDIVIATAKATAACGGRARYVPKVGSRSMRDEPRHWTFNLQKVNGQWLIERVASR